jgi:hypothetical protein
MDDKEIPRQSGMERSHEKWVLETLNFLMSMNIPVHRKDARGKRITGDLEIPERLGLVAKKVADACGDASRARIAEADARKELREAKAKIADLESRARLAVDLLAPPTPDKDSNQELVRP